VVAEQPTYLRSKSLSSPKGSCTLLGRDEDQIVEKDNNDSSNRMKNRQIKKTDYQTLRQKTES